MHRVCDADAEKANNVDFDVNDGLNNNVNDEEDIDATPYCS